LFGFGIIEMSGTENYLKVDGGSGIVL
jgi:hypothetical protein